jgi:hypothetical protein
MEGRRWPITSKAYCHYRLHSASVVFLFLPMLYAACVPVHEVPAFLILLILSLKLLSVN